LPEENDKPAGSGPPSLSLPTLVGLGLANACCLAVGLVVGHLLDVRLGTAPVFILLGIGLGLGVGAVGSFLEIRRYLQE